MIYLPDTNSFSAHFSGKSSSLSSRLNHEMEAGNLVLSVIVLAELEFGAHKAKQDLGSSRFTTIIAKLKTILPPEPLEENFASSYARIRYHLESTGNQIGERDLLIASHALCLNASVLTRNIREFQRVPGLHVESWQADALA